MDSPKLCDQPFGASMCFYLEKAYTRNISDYQTCMTMATDPRDCCQSAYEAAKVTQLYQNHCKASNDAKYRKMIPQ